MPAEVPRIISIEECMVMLKVHVTQNRGSNPQNVGFFRFVGARVDVLAI